MAARLFPVVCASACFLVLNGCVIDTVRTGPLEHDTRSIDLDKSEKVRVELKMGVGNLNVTGGSKKLMDADFSYNVPSWKPEVRYTTTGAWGNLTVEQPGGTRNTGGSVKYNWDLRFNNDVPLEMTAHFGVGEAELNLGAVTLRNLEIHMGVGTLKLDLRGNPKRDYDVRIRGGVGEATIYLPDKVGVEADASGGIGGIDVRGLEKRGGRYINDAYDNAKVRIHLDVRGGVGAIHLIAE